MGELIEDAPDLEKLRGEVAKERERQEKKNGPPSEEPEDIRLSADTEAKRAKLLTVTQGKTCLFIGGHPSDKHRLRLEQALELSQLLWPETDRFDANPAKFTSELKQSDIVVLLVNQMRKGMKAVKAHRKANGKQVVHLTHGYNVAQVIHSFDEQLNGSER